MHKLLHLTKNRWIFLLGWPPFIINVIISTTFFHFWCTMNFARSAIFEFFHCSWPEMLIFKIRLSDDGEDPTFQKWVEIKRKKYFFFSNVKNEKGLNFEKFNVYYYQHHHFPKICRAVKNLSKLRNSSVSVFCYRVII